MRILLMVILFFPLPIFAEVFKCVSDGRVTYSESLCVGRVPYDDPQFESSKFVTLSIRMDASSIYRVRGFVAGVPETFMVDTGASQTTISGPLAYKIGIRSCVADEKVITANGSVKTCRVVVPSISFGGFEFKNHSVLVSVSMTGPSLIGNDILSQMSVTSRDGVLTLSR